MADPPALDPSVAPAGPGAAPIVTYTSPRKVDIKIGDLANDPALYADWKFKAIEQICAQGVETEYNNRVADANYVVPEAKNRILKECFSQLVSKLPDGSTALATARGVTGRCCAALFKALDRVFNSQVAGARLSNISKLLKEPRKADDDLTTYIQEKKDILTEKLQNRIDPEEILLLGALSNMGAEYQSVCNTMLSKEGVTLESCMPELLQTEASYANQTGESDISNALQAEGANLGKAAEAKLVEKITLKVGKMIENQRQKGKGKGKHGKNSNGKNWVPKGPKCWTCGNFGHVSTNCTKKVKKTGEKTDKKGGKGKTRT